jgi:hypothetical protein
MGIRSRFPRGQAFAVTPTPAGMTFSPNPPGSGDMLAEQFRASRADCVNPQWVALSVGSRRLLRPANTTGKAFFCSSGIFFRRRAKLGTPIPLQVVKNFVQESPALAPKLLSCCLFGSRYLCAIGLGSFVSWPHRRCP